jgi:hypothetical protein
VEYVWLIWFCRPHFKPTNRITPGGMCRSSNAAHKFVSSSIVFWAICYPTLARRSKHALLSISARGKPGLKLRCSAANLLLVTQNWLPSTHLSCENGLRYLLFGLWLKPNEPKQRISQGLNQLTDIGKYVLLSRALNLSGFCSLETQKNARSSRRPHLETWKAGEVYARTSLCRSSSAFIDSRRS